MLGQLLGCILDHLLLKQLKKTANLHTCTYIHTEHVGEIQFKVKVYVRLASSHSTIQYCMREHEESR